MEDPSGKIKCQESAQVDVSSMFSAADLAEFEAYGAELGFEPGKHWRHVPCMTDADCPQAGAKSGSQSPDSNEDIYTTCDFGAGGGRYLLFGSKPQEGVCMPVA